MTGFEEHKLRYPLFHQNPFIREMADKYRWTVSNPNSKMPINIRVILDGKEKLYGARHYDERDLATLEELTNASPDIINCALYLNSQQDQYVCLDIEKTCPTKVKNDLLKLPYVYGETSMSGKGVHLILPLPDDWYENDDYKVIREKTVSREPHGWYELLSVHFVTFTRNMLKPSKNKKDWPEFLKEFNKTQRASKKITRTEKYQEIDVSDIPMGHEILNLLSEVKISKKPEDYYGNMSNYEFAVAMILNGRMNNILSTAFVQKKGHDYTHQERCTLLYAALEDRLEHRSKHDESRNGAPYLYYTAENCILKSES